MISQPHKLGALMVAIAVLVLTATGCGTSKGSTVTKESSMSFDEAVAEAKSQAQATHQLLGGTLRPLDERGDVVPCRDEAKKTKGDPVRWSNVFMVDGWSPDPAKLDEFEKAFSARGWEKRYGSRSDGRIAMGKDHFTTVLTIKDQSVNIAVETACVAPKDPDKPWRQ